MFALLWPSLSTAEDELRTAEAARPAPVTVPAVEDADRPDGHRGFRQSWHEAEGAGYGPHDVEVAAIEGGDLVDLHPLGGGHHRRVDGAER
jgi:hypothetical protein